MVFALKKIGFAAYFIIRKKVDTKKGQSKAGPLI